MEARFDKFSRCIGLAAFLLLVFNPLGALLLEMVQTCLTEQVALLNLFIPEGRRLILLTKSVGLACGTAASVTILGFWAATAAWRWQGGIAKYLRWLPAAFIIIPPYIHALAWSAAISGLSGFAKGQSNSLLQGWLISWWVQSMALLPIGYCMALLGLESIEKALVETGRLMRSDLIVLGRVILPLAAPFLMAAAGFAFLLSFTDYTVPSLFGVNVYAMEIFAEYSASSDPEKALAIALPALFITILVVIALQAGLRDAAQKVNRRVHTWSIEPSWPTWLTNLQQLAVSFVVMQMGVLLTSLVAATGTWKNFRLAIASASSEIAYTFWISCASALVCLPIALAVAAKLVRSDLRGRLWWLLVTLPLAVPAPLVGIGLIFVWNRSFQPAIYGSSLMLVFAALARFMPLSVLVLLPQLRRIDPLLVDAARVIQIHPLQTAIKIRLPMLTPGLLAAAFVTFALTTGELGASLLVAPPGSATLTMRIYNYLHYGASDTVAGLCLAMVGMSLCAAALSMIAWAGWARLLRKPSEKCQ